LTVQRFQRLALLKFGALGDVLMSTPLLRQLRGKFPEAVIDYWVAESFAGALVENPHVSNVVRFPPGALINRPGEFLALARSLRQGRYDAILLLDKHPVFGVLARLAGIPLRIGFARDSTMRWLINHCEPYGELRHEVYCDLDLMKGLGAQPDYEDVALDYFPRTPVDPADEFAAGNFAVCINSGGNNARETTNLRRLETPLFQEILHQLAQHGSVILLGSASDGEFYRSVKLPGNVRNLAGQLSLAQSAWLLERSAQVLCTDCGAMHLATAAKAPRIATIWGPTHPERKKPLIGQVVTLWKDEDKYDPAYEIHGTQPTQRFHQSITPADLGAATRWAPTHV
jgi:ADP-heptose:LPS heptosyltransferase